MLIFLYTLFYRLAKRKTFSICRFLFCWTSTVYFHFCRLYESFVNGTSHDLSLESIVFRRRVVVYSGPLTKAPLLEGARHPAILDNTHNVTRMIMRHTHMRLNCAGPSHCLSSEVYAQLAVSSSCGTCRRRISKPQPLVMADLPKTFLGYQLPPFANTGVDYLAPICAKLEVNREALRSSVHMPHCRAVHIETAHSLGTGAFIIALR